MAIFSMKLGFYNKRNLRLTVFDFRMGLISAVPSCRGNGRVYNVIIYIYIFQKVTFYSLPLYLLIFFFIYIIIFLNSFDFNNIRPSTFLRSYDTMAARWYEWLNS